MTPRIVVVGDAFLDRDVDGTVERVSPDAPAPVLDEAQQRARPGGAGLAAALSAHDGCMVTLVSAIGDDDAGRELLSLLDESGVDVVNLGLDGTTREKIRFRAGGRSLLRLDRGDGRAVLDQAALSRASAAIRSASAVHVADYGGRLTAFPAVRATIGALPVRVPVLWDPHPAGADPMPGARLVTPNESEAARFAPEVGGIGLAAVAARARELAMRWRAAAVAVTLGPDGALVGTPDGSAPLVVPATPVAAADTCGAGDRFASVATRMLAEGALPSEAVETAVSEASRFVAAGAAAAMRIGPPPLDGRRDDPFELSRLVRARGGTVVATGGCFDLLHPGHVSTLRAARALGDILIVCLNSDASVRGVKGPGRPLIPETDRAAVLEALDCVDAVVVFDEETPSAVLQRLRPDIFAKGGDYAAAEIPEIEVMREWGGQVVVLPYMPGRSTSRIMEEVLRRATQ